MYFLHYIIHENAQTLAVTGLTDAPAQEYAVFSYFLIALPGEIWQAKTCIYVRFINTLYELEINYSLKV